MRPLLFQLPHLVASAALALLPATQAVAAACQAQSGTHRAALVQLFTSEGCSDCPPADARLDTLGNAASAQTGAIIPIALHVNYWDDQGWRDPFADPAYGDVQEWMVHATGGRVVYTPHFFINGTPLLDWRSRLDDLMNNATRQNAPAGVYVDATPQEGNKLTVSAKASGLKTDAQLRVAVVEGGLVSHVVAGENSGATLTHAHVVRALSPALSIHNDNPVQTTLAIPAATGKKVRVVAWLQNPQTAEVVQAVSTADCAR
ncbi:DUF1223 domain-containing protein [Silvimonas iriomotensis]|uniref:DUF1223 domain-containing protein n=1 Tax=Silvimonas iriomotensis TaxID=449662 RepID=A0ABQ2PEY9_9NEIS|nr:DUF1223 domain-containing protein [Silvimonas iriomotensis]GGP23903.1 hypothetical protein GCM10010970_39030 [Silvimonas iriomotensis]